MKFAYYHCIGFYLLFVNEPNLFATATKIFTEQARWAQVSLLAAF